MSKKIIVSVAGFPSELATLVAEAVCSSPDLKLSNMALSEDSFSNQHLYIGCVYMGLFNQDRANIFFENSDKFDVLVDCFEEKNEKRMAMINDSQIQICLFEGNSSNTVEEIMDNIRASFQTRQQLTLA